MGDVFRETWVDGYASEELEKRMQVSRLFDIIEKIWSWMQLHLRIDELYLLCIFRGLWMNGLRYRMHRHR